MVFLVSGGMSEDAKHNPYHNIILIDFIKVFLSPTNRYRTTPLKNIPIGLSMK